MERLTLGKPGKELTTKGTKIIDSLTTFRLILLRRNRMELRSNRKNSHKRTQKAKNSWNLYILEILIPLSHHPSS